MDRLTTVDRDRTRPIQTYNMKPISQYYSRHCLRNLQVKEKKCKYAEVSIVGLAYSRIWHSETKKNDFFFIFLLSFKNSVFYFKQSNFAKVKLKKVFLGINNLYCEMKVSLIKSSQIRGNDHLQVATTFL